MKPSNALPQAQFLSAYEVEIRPLAWLGLFSTLFPGEMKLLERAGIHPVRSDLFRNPYAPDDREYDFRNIGEHSIAVAASARVLARALVEANAMETRLFRRTVQRALLHDIAKPFEVLYWRSGGEAGNAQQPREDLVRTLGHSIPSYLLQLARTAGVEAGHSSFRHFLETDSNLNIRLRPQMLAEKVVHLCDTFVSSSVPADGSPATTSLVTPGERAYRCEHRYPFMSNGGLALRSNGDIVDVDDRYAIEAGSTFIGTYSEIQVFVAEQISLELQHFLIPRTQSTPEESCRFILRLIETGLRDIR